MTERIAVLPKENPLRFLIRTAGKDIGDLFVNKLGVIGGEAIRQAENDTHFWLLPGQALAISIQAALSLDLKKNQYLQNLGLPPEKLRKFEILRGALMEAAAGGFRDLILNRAYVRLGLNLTELAVTLAVPLHLKLPAITMFTAISLLRAPYNTYHEMLHRLSCPDFVDRWGVGFNETLTDFLVRAVGQSGQSRLARYLLVYNRFSLFDENLLYQRRLMDTLFERLSERMGAREALQCLTRSYFHEGNEAMLALDKCTNGEGNLVVGILNSKRQQREKIGDLNSLFDQNRFVV